jgi:hypothetical protein
MQEHPEGNSRQFFIDLMESAGLQLSEEQQGALPLVYPKLLAAMVVLRRPDRAADSQMASIFVPPRGEEE